MAGDDRTSAGPLIDQISKDARRYSFYQTVSLVQRRYGSSSEPTGFLGPVDQEVLRFRPNASFGFPEADVQTMENIARDGADQPIYRLTVNFIGLYGPSSPLPAFYTEEILAADFEECHRRDFMDFFHHRLISLQYRIWLKYRYHLRYQPGAEDQTSNRVYAFLGLGSPESRRGLRLLYVERLLSSVGLLAMRSRAPGVISGIVSHYFEGVAVQVEQFIRRTVEILPEQRMRLGVANTTLGQDAVPGKQLQDIAGKFRVILGPLSFERFCAFLPNGSDYDHLRELLNVLLRDPLDFDFDLRLRRDERPDLSLAADCQARLGWSSWLGTGGDVEPRVILSVGGL